MLKINSAQIYSPAFIKIAFFVILFHCCTSLPVNTSKNSYSEFIEDLTSNHCVFPQEIQLPFQNPQLKNFEYLSSYLTICQNSKSTLRSREAVILCKEIFDNLRNISCSAKTNALPDINIKLSQQVCSDINALKNSVPENDKSLLRRLTDSLLCDIMCEDEFEKACQVLLWGYEIRKQINSVNAPNNEEISALPKVDSGKNNIIEVQEKENKLNINIKPNQSKTSENQPSKKMPPVDVPDPLKGDEEQGKHLANKILLDESEHKDQNQLAASMSIAKTNSNLPEHPQQTTNERIEDQTHELAEDKASIPNNLNNEFVQEKENPINLVSDEKSKNAQNDLKETSRDLPNNNGLSHFNNLVENNHEGNIVSENKKDIDIENTSFLHENVANTETEKPVKMDKTENINVNNKNETQAIATDVEQTAVDNTDTEVPSKQIQEQESEDTAANRNEIEDNQHHSNSIVSNTDQNNENAKNQAKVVTNQGNTTDKTKNILTDKPTIPVKAEESDKIGKTVTVSEQTSLNADVKTSTKDSSIPKTSISNSDLSVTNSPSQAPAETTVALEQMEEDDHQPADKEPDQYTDDLENNGDDGEYSRPDYEGNLYENTKTKETNPDIPNGVDIPAPKEVVTSQNEKPMEFSSRDSFRQESSDIQMIAAFPEQEDSHFFFYFLSIVLILMAGYLIFHNKQKIIALIVEGRHERNRRSHRAGYKKLETK